MAFRTVDFRHLAKFNSANSSDFIDLYEKIVEDNILQKASEPSSRTFAPSSIRCKRKSWFRLRGVEPDQPKSADRVLNFTADLGTACHEVIQSNLKAYLREAWIDVAEYLKQFPIPYEYEVTAHNLETRVKILNPPIRFACDGIIFWKGKYWLLEIKTCDHSSFVDLTDPKPQHIDQIKCYSSLLNISNVLVLYQDRQYGDLKCYELTVSESEMQAVKDDFQYVMDMVEANLAPEGLPKGDGWCTPGQCPYYKKCKSWG